jgi:hypothetical protein
MEGLCKYSDHDPNKRLLCKKWIRTRGYLAKALLLPPYRRPGRRGRRPVLMASPRGIPPLLDPAGEYLQLLAHSRPSRIPRLRRSTASDGGLRYAGRPPPRSPPRSAGAERRDGVRIIQKLGALDAPLLRVAGCLACCSAQCVVWRPPSPCACSSLKKLTTVAIFNPCDLRIHGCAELSMRTLEIMAFSFQPKEAIKDRLSDVD